MWYKRVRTKLKCTHTAQYGNTEVVFNKLKHGIPREDIDSYDTGVVTSPPLNRPTSVDYETNAAFPRPIVKRVTSHDPNINPSFPESSSPGKFHRTSVLSETHVQYTVLLLFYQWEGHYLTLYRGSQMFHHL